MLPDIAVTDAPDVVVPLRSAGDDGGAQRLSNLIWQQLHEHVSPQVLTAIAEGVWEVVANALRANPRQSDPSGTIHRVGWAVIAASNSARSGG